MGAGPLLPPIWQKKGSDPAAGRVAAEETPPKLPISRLFCFVLSSGRTHGGKTSLEHVNAWKAEKFLFDGPSSQLIEDFSSQEPESGTVGTLTGDVGGCGEEVRVAMNASYSGQRETCALALQGLWELVRAHLEDVLLSPYLPASFAFLTHVLFCAPFLALDALGHFSPRVRAWRIGAGSGRPPSLRRWADCFWRVLYRYLTVVLPAAALFQTLRSPALPALAPSCWRLVGEVGAASLLFDTFVFIWHFSMHR